MIKVNAAYRLDLASEAKMGPEDLDIELMSKK